ncbi:hypothetical protein D9611_005877 [Ephemerocybe angulata]|uniref:MYND-type domain-containing protein n=1 Tax=Ephemerocybe angulata TaxID=980116 RepID=A0A8H5FLF0_9AGAR|nr:hypothetical protein D9611_005877 [Tulosesus angulatus]
MDDVVEPSAKSEKYMTRSRTMTGTPRVWLPSIRTLWRAVCADQNRLDRLLSFPHAPAVATSHSRLPDGKWRMPPTQSHFRVDALLKAAERGSIPHLKRLEHEWPTDPSLSQRALMILLEHFKAEAPHLRHLQSRESKRASPIVLAAFGGLEGAFKSLASATETKANQITAAFHPYLQEYFAGLRYIFYIASRSHDTMKLSSTVATRVVFLFGAGLCNTDVPDILECILDMSLYLFMDDTLWKWREGKIFTQAQYDDIVAPKFGPLGFCIRHPSTREALFKKLNQATTDSLKRLCDTFIRQSLECSAGWQGTPGMDGKTFSSYVSSAFILCTQVPRFFKLLLKYRFPAFALKAALTVPLAPACNLPRGSLALETACAMFNCEILLAGNSRRLIVQLLEAGLIETLLNDLLSPRLEGKEEKVFEEFTFQFDTMTPLKALTYASYDPRISNALHIAIMAIPPQQMNHTAYNIWKPFVDSCGWHRDALRRLPNDHIPLCDSLQHPSTSKADGLGASKECSGCHTTVYCSTDCQREDWSSLHREECTRSRVELIDHQLKGSSISHRTRLYNILHLEAIMHQAASQWSEKSDEWARKPVCIVDADIYPVTLGFDTVEEAGTSTRFGANLFECARSRAMLRQVAEGDSAVLAVCISAFGRCGVFTFARFGVDGSSMTFHLQGGFCRAVDASDIGLDYLNV